MKKLKIFLPILLISLFFIPKVFANTISNYNVTIKYSDTMMELINSNETRLNNLHSYLNTINTFGSSPFPTHTLSSGDYVLSISGMSSSSIWYVSLLNVNKNNSYNPRFYSRFNDSNHYFYWGSTNVMYIRLQINWNGNTITSHSTYTQGSGGWGGSSSNYVNGCNPVSSDCTFEITNAYYDTYFLNSSRSLKFVDYSTIQSNDTSIQIPIKSGNVVYTVDDNIPMKDFFDSFKVAPNPYICTIDTSLSNLNSMNSNYLSNISDFSYQITAQNLRSQDYPIQSSFVLSNPVSDIDDTNFQNTSNWEVEIIKGPTSVGEYNVNGNITWNNSSKSLQVVYSVVATGSSPANVDAIIKVKPLSSDAKNFFKGSLYVYYCIPSDNTQNKDLNIITNYAYTDNTTGLTNSYDTSLMNFLNNPSSPSMNFFSELRGIMATGPVDSILTLPLTMLSSLTTAMGDTCTPLTINIPYLNRNVVIPCISTFYDNIGATSFFNVVGGIASTIILAQYFIFLYNWVDNTLRFGEHNLKMWGVSNR